MDDLDVNPHPSDPDAPHDGHFGSDDHEEHYGLPFEHLELREYIRAFESSADRVRWVTFIMTVLAAVIFVTTWNGGDSWLRHRYETLRDLKKSTDQIEDPVARQAAIQKKVGNIFSAEELNAMVRKLRDQRVERLLMFEVRWLGVSIDFNDIVIFAGLTFVLLFVLLLLSLIRYHENLYLALYKVRRLANRDRNRARGESKANFLYHALAMAQVLSFPPTLARWSVRRAQTVLHVILLIVPVFLLGYTTWTNWNSRILASQYHVSDRIGLQVGLCFTLLFFAIVCFRYSTAASARWIGAFFYVNPVRRFADPPPWYKWLRLPREEHERPHIEIALLAELAEGGEVRRFCPSDATDKFQDRIRFEPNRTVIHTPHHRFRSGDRKRFAFTEQEAFAAAIHQKAHSDIALKIKTEDFHVLDHEIVANLLTPTQWSICIRWTIEHDALPAVGPNDQTISAAHIHTARGGPNPEPTIL